MQIWDAQFAARSPLFEPLRVIADTMQGTAWPAPEAFTALATAHAVVSGGGQPLRFADASGRPAPAAADYELRIHDAGVVPLRAANWHDFFNALVWLAFPQTKAALNRVHAAELRAGQGGARNRRRDVATLFDESGVLVLGSDRAVLERLRAFEWRRVFWDERETLLRTTRFFIFGHGLYEKALSPYVGMTGHALVLEVPAAFEGADLSVLVACADGLAAHALQVNITQPRDLSPLPVLGVPGWWDANRDAGFYDNAAYFRPRRARSA